MVAGGLEEPVPVQAACYKLADPLCLRVVCARPGAGWEKLHLLGNGGSGKLI